MSQSLLPYNEAQGIWQSLVKNGKKIDLGLELEIYKKILNITHVGDYYFYVFDLATVEFEFVSPNMTNILGYTEKEFTVELFIQLIHPDDLPYFLSFEKKGSEFFNTLAPAEYFKYKVRYDYRVKKSNGEYIRILHQVVTLQSTEEGGINKTLGIHTDINHIKPEGTPILSFIGLEGEPSYINVAVKQILMPTKEILTRREKEIVRQVIQGFNSAEIAELLFISQYTVKNHRRNILAKTNTSSTAELVSKAIKEGWV
ncbi:MAG: LuxR C-terminal-related transcriptional regulator [Paludibacter sp.]|nr:LuxR C-terminal-related transcriptional regulator [Paludibacter sp.]